MRKTRQDNVSQNKAMWDNIKHDKTSQYQTIVERQCKTKQHKPTQGKTR